jgi:hypothetical protein
MFQRVNRSRHTGVVAAGTRRSSQRAVLRLEELEQRLVLSVNTITYNQITSLDSSTGPLNATPDTLLDANGNRAVFETYSNGVTKVFTVNSDGTGLTLVDPNNGSNGHDALDISADGSVVLETLGHGDNGVEYRIVNADGTNMHDAYVVGNLEETPVGRLSADGKTVYFTADASFPFQSPNPDPAGLYAVAASGGSQPQLIASLAQVEALMGGPSAFGPDGPDIGGGAFSLGSSSDGSRLVFTVGGSNGGDAELGVNSDGSGLHVISWDTANPSGIGAAGISGDGSKVFVYENTFADGHPYTLTVSNFDGSNPVVLNNLPSDFSFAGGDEHLELTQDGSKLLFGTSSYLVNTDNSGIVQIGTNAANANLVQAHLSHATMNSTGTEFLYAMSDVNNVQQLAVANLNPTLLGADPAIRNVTINPSFIVIAPGSPTTTTTITAQVAGTTRDVSEAFLYNGVSSNNQSSNNNTVDAFADQQLFDDGTNGDVTAGDGIYTNNHIGTEGTVVGPRQVRVTAETLDNSGFLHATAVQVDGPTESTYPGPVPILTVIGTVTADSSGFEHGNVFAYVTSPTGPVKEGQVVFMVGGQTVTANVSNGTASAQVVLPPSTDPNNLTVTAQYVDPSNPSTPPNFNEGNPVTVKVIPVPPTVTVVGAATATASASAQQVAVTATVSSSGNPVPEGTVTFTLGSVTASAPVSNGKASAMLSLPAGFAPGQYNVAASYADTNNPPMFDSSGDTVSTATAGTLTVNPAGTTTTVVSTSAPANGSAQQVAVTATVSSSGNPVPEGTVTFTLGNLTASAPVSNGMASAMLTLPAGFSPGNYTVAASYTDTGSNPLFVSSGGPSSSTTPGTLTVTLPSTTTTVANASVTANGAAQQVAVTATVTSSDGTVNEGTVTFTLGNVTVSAPVVNGSASATLTLPAGSPPGNYSVSASYADTGSNPKFTSSSGPFSSTTPGTLTVSPPPPAPTPTPTPTPTPSAAPTPSPTPTPTPASPPSLHKPSWLAFLDQLSGAVEIVNPNGTETVAESLFGLPLFVSTYNASGNLVSVTIFGINITFLFLL